MDMNKFAQQCVSDSNIYFPDMMARSLRQKVVHHGLGVAGEAGEVAEAIKKYDRGSLTTEQLQERLSEELVDVLIYLGNLAGLLEIDLEMLYNRKREYNNKRREQNGHW